MGVCGVSEGGAMRQVSIDQLYVENQQRLGLIWLVGRQGGNRVLTGETSLKPTIGQVGHMNFIHPFRVQIIGAAEAAYLSAVYNRAGCDHRRQWRGRSGASARRV
jgi:serine kinase of HPr protein (carbohydrate metabolism regulator)